MPASSTNPQVPTLKNPPNAQGHNHTMDEAALKELRLASRLLICPHPEDSDTSAKYLDGKACDTVAAEFVKQSAEVEALYKNSTFESYLQSGMAALKTVFCL